MQNTLGGKLSPFKYVGFVFFALSILTVTMPILAMSGGQWGRWLFLRIGANSLTGGGVGAQGRELFYHPQNKLWPIGAVIYAILLVLILYYGIKSYRNKHE